MTSRPLSPQFEIVSPATHADYERMIAPLAKACWPEFMLHDPVADRNWHKLFERFSDYQFGMYDSSAQRAAAMGNSVPIHWSSELNDLPEGGWDRAFEQAVSDDEAGMAPNLQCAIQIAIHPDYQRQGLSAQMVQAMRNLGKSKGFQHLIAPVRPSQKAEYPLTDIDDYVSWKTEQGLPFDAWLRVHARAGATIIKVCHKSMTIQGTRTDWEAWTNLRFAASGPYVVYGALNPIYIDIEKDQGTYTEPNVWMVHDLR